MEVVHELIWQGTVVFLLEQGDDAMLTDTAGNTALTLAEEAGQAEVAVLLEEMRSTCPLFWR